MTKPNITTIIFDLGGVLIDWNPRYLYKQLFEEEERMEHFLANICTPHWNEQQDAGRSLQEATELLVAEFPEHEDHIRAYYDRWEEMLGGHLEETADLLRRLHQSTKYKLYALTNWSGETFPVALQRFDFLHLFDGILVSGDERLKKPDPKIYELLLERYRIEPSEAVFTDDNPKNAAAAEAVGMYSIHFQSAQQLEEDLNKLGVVF